MSTLIKHYWHYVIVAVLLVVGLSEYAAVAQGAPPVFLTRLGGVITTWPRNVKYSVGTTTPRAKLSVYANRGEAQSTFLLEAASSTVSGTTNHLFSVSATGTTRISGGTPTGTASGTLAVFGCVNITPTSSATMAKLVLSDTGATSTFHGTAFWAFGTCP